MLLGGCDGAVRRYASLMIGAGYEFGVLHCMRTPSQLIVKSPDSMLATTIST